ncbi:dnaJ homolog subfamily C member 14 isoform X2 [Jatropha curcas]|uniref:dnaJ homolog subfamily C member 14 isoform X2 n=1 Tax=Jatropha curcas TaxID=180498 RepID=UPI0009D6B7B9|nr:dnaJ homolog subfamily C member 14 isoform X2 [Jatropha curcas]XP_037495932.1 dnaJ homolog subfamily C member 14 isoform X2 [Jatropha curcas]
MDHRILKVPQEVEIAKEKIISIDYVGARKKLLEIQFHFPAFDNISGMITVCDILNSAGYRFLGSNTNYYWVLEVCPDATEFAMKTQYNKFLTLLEPIKNNFPKAASALKIIQEAFTVLSDPEGRSMFDMNRAMRLQSYASGNLQDICIGEFAAWLSSNHKRAEIFSEVYKVSMEDSG